jgi:hypothetical protein
MISQRRFLMVAMAIFFLTGLIPLSGLIARNIFWQRLQTEYRHNMVDGGQGLLLRSFENASWQGAPLQSTLVARIDLARKMTNPEQEEYSLDFSGFLAIPRPGWYRLATYSKDGSNLALDGRSVVENSGRHPPREFSGQVYLEPGWHYLVVRYACRQSSYEPGQLAVFFKNDDGSRVELASDALVPARQPYQADNWPKSLRPYQTALRFVPSLPEYLGFVSLLGFILLLVILGWPAHPGESGHLRPISRSFGPNPSLVALLLFIFLLQAFFSLRQKSATFDEPINITAGYAYLKNGAYCEDPTHPPALRLLAALPLLLMDIALPAPEDWYTPKNIPLRPADCGYSLLSRYFFFKENAPERLLLPSRLVVVALSLLLGFLVFRLASRLYGEAAGCLALFFYVFNPNILAHGQLVTTDLAISLLLFATLFFFFGIRQRLGLRTLAGLGVCFGLAFATKASALLLLPILALGGGLALVSRWKIPLSPTLARFLAPLARLPGLAFLSRPGQPLRTLFLLGLTALTCLFIAWFVLWGIYGFHYATSCYGQDQRDLLRQQYSPASFEKPWVRFLSDYKLLPAAYIHSLIINYSMLRESGHIAYLFGHFSYSGWGYYDSLTFLLKTPLPMLLLLLLLLFGQRLQAASPGSRPMPYGLGSRGLVVAVLFFFFSTLFNSSNIGVRYLLPVYPWLAVLLGQSWFLLRHPQRWLRRLVTGFVIWSGLSCLLIYPDYLAYFSDIIGGASNGYKYLADSNIDWGQDLHGLKKYLDEQGLDRVKLSYFGSAIPQSYQIPFDYLASYVIAEPQNAGEAVRPGDYVAVSVNLLQGLYYERIRGFDEYWRQGLRPVARIGYSIFIFKIPESGQKGAARSISNQNGPAGP